MDQDSTEQKSMNEELSSMYRDIVDNWGITSFSDLENVDRSEDVIDDLMTLQAIAGIMLGNIRAYSDDKISAVRKMLTEYDSMAMALLDEYENRSDNKEERKVMLDELSNLFNVFRSKEKKYKTEGGVKYSASDYLYVGDSSKPSTWKLRIAEGSSGHVTIAQLGRAAAAFSSGGFRGNKVQLPSGEAGKIKAKLRRLYKKLGAKDEDIPESIKKEQPFMLFKDALGNWRWFARYSNNYRDNDRPAEIISKQSHLDFVKMVDSGQAPMPELWHWHIPGSKWGEADWVAYDEDNGIAMAAGYVLSGHEKEAEALSDLIDSGEFDLGVSHGMPRPTVKYDSADDSIIVAHITKEISDLPLWAAANKLTSFSIFKEKDMAVISAQKKEYLKAVGFSDEAIEDIEAGNKALAEFAKQAEIESKEASENENDEAPQVDENQAEAEAQEKEQETPAEDVSSDETKSDAEADEQKEGATVALVGAVEVADAIAQVSNALMDEIKSLKSQIDDLRKERDEEKEKQSATPDEYVPTASLAAMIAKQLSAVGSKEAAVHKNSTLAKSGPDETPVEDETNTLVNTGNPVIDSVISGVIGRK